MGTGDIAPHFLTLALEASCSLHTLGTQWIRRRVGSRVVLATVEREKSCTATNRTQAVQPIAHCYPDS